MNVNLRPYYAEGSKTVGYEIAEQLGWRLPDNVVVPDGGRIADHQDPKAFGELIELGLVEAKPVQVLWRAGDRLLSDFDRGESGQHRDRTAEAEDHRALAGHRQSGRRPLRHQDHHESGGWAEDVSDAEVVESIQLLAETEGVFTETAGGVTVGCARKLYRAGPHPPDETTVLCITGNGLKTTDALTGKYEVESPIAPKLAEFEAYLSRSLNLPETVAV